MRKLSIGKVRGLQQITSPDGIFIMCAIDHRGSLRKMLAEEHPGGVDYDVMVEHKIELCSILAEYSSAILLDPIFGAAQCISQGVLPSSTGLLVSLEASGYEGGKENRVTDLLDGWSVDKIRRMGASAVKLLVYYRPDLRDLASQQLNIVDTVARECLKYDLPFLVEPVSYPIGSEVDNPQQFAALKERLVIKTAEEIAARPIDVLKAEFPADLNYKKDKAELIDLCQQLDRSSPVPWVVLSAGVDFEQFLQEVEIACRGGASGFLGGRAIWQEAMHIDSREERVKYLSTVVVDRSKRLADVAGRYGVPWYKKLGLAAHELSLTSEKWYKEYQNQGEL